MNPFNNKLDISTEAPLFKNRNELIKWIPHKGIGIEIGVNAGEFSKIILEKNDPQKLYLVDCWEHQDHYCWVDDSNIPTEDKLKLLETIKERYKLDDRVVIKRGYSLDIVKTFDDNYFDWIYIDADHWKIYEDITAWMPKLKEGGYMMGHDYMDSLASPKSEIPAPIPVKKFIDWYTKMYSYKLHITGVPNFKSFMFRKVPPFKTNWEKV